MKVFRPSGLFAALFGVLAVGASHARAADDFAPGEIMVKSTASGASNLKQFVANSGAHSVTTFSKIGWQRIKLPAGTDVSAALAQYKKVVGVVAVEPNYIYKALKTPSDPRYSELYGLAKIGAPEAWNVTTGSQDVVVAVIDTGIKYDHPDLQANMWKNGGEIPNNGKDDDHNGIVDDVYGADFVNGDGNPMDDNGHGTHCAGTIGAVGNNKVGVVGVNWKVKLMALKILDANGVSLGSEAISAFQYAIAMKKRGVNIRVTSNSWGSVGKSQAIEDVMQEAADEGIISICAAGNDTTNTDKRAFNPSGGDVTGLVSVGATDADDNLADFSNYGHKTVDLAAPGVDILSTYIGSGGNAYTIESGTSMACPHVAGAAALLLAQAPSLSVEAVKARLLKAVDVIPSLKNTSVTGGRLSLAKLLSGGIYSLRGKVTDSSKKPVAGAQIYLNNAQSPIATAKFDGTYSVDGLEAGSYKATAKLKGWAFKASTSSVTLGAAKSGYVATVDFVGTAQSTLYTIQGSVYQLNDTKKTYIKGARIFITGVDEPVAVSDSHGQYTITGRPAGTYYVKAEFGGYVLNPLTGLTLDGSAKISLPKQAAEKTDFVARVEDFEPPIVTVRAPTYFGEYGQGELKKAVGTATDPSGVAEIDFALAKEEDNGESYYLWDTKTWSAPTFDVQIPIKGLLTQTFSGTTVNWSVDLPDLQPGDYDFFNFPSDTLGNSIVLEFPTYFTVVSGESSQTAYPNLDILRPLGNEAIPAGISYTAKGKVSDAQGVQTIYIYLRRYDVNGAILGYYDWVTGEWTTDTSDMDIYAAIEEKGKKSTTWSKNLPPLVAGNYELGAFGRDIFGNEPNLDSSEDTTVTFTAKNGTGVTGSAMTKPSGGGS